MNADANILIVDDEPANRHLLESILKREGYRTCSAVNGREALAKVKDGSVDLVLLDWMMPVLDGVDTCRAIRDDLGLPVLPVVLVTALTDRASRVRGKQAGADDFLSKPVCQEELIARVRVLLRVKRYHEAIEQQRAALDVARRRLTSLLVHDLKNPLGVIRLNLEHIREHTRGGEDRELREAAADAFTSCNQIQRMLVDLIDIGLAEDGRLPFAPEHGDLAALLVPAAAHLRPAIEARGASVRVDVAADLPRLSFDPSLLLRVLQNLMGNATRFVGAGGVVELAVQARGGRVVVTVGNDGPSIPRAAQARLFDQFGQVHESQAQDNRGLGLYLCRLVAERHGGSIGVRDRAGSGVCFDVELPVAPAAPAGPCAAMRRGGRGAGPESAT